MNQTQPLTEEEQKKLSEPLVKPEGLAADEEKFLNLVVQKVDDGNINLLIPDTLINKAVYERLDEAQQGKVDFDAVNLAASLREIYNLWKYYRKPTYQIENLVHRVRLTKERLEDISGDVFVI